MSDRNDEPFTDEELGLNIPNTQEAVQVKGMSQAYKWMKADSRNRSLVATEDLLRDYDSLLSAAREAVKALNCDTCHSCSKHFAALARLREYTE